MLRITVSTSAAAAKQYYTEGLTRAADYYLDGQATSGQWCGKAAAMLGLTGEVNKSDFFALLDNTHPGTGGTLTARQKTNRRPGADFTFNAPKGFSVLREWTDDSRLDDAFRTAVEETLQHDLEPLIQTRVRKNGALATRSTGNMLAAVFYDSRTRPVDGIEDPHTHAHAYIPNVTWDPEEGCFKAIEYYDAHLNRPYLEAAFHARLSALVRSLGYPIKRMEKWWDVALPDTLVEKFSRRTKAIEDRAKQLGLIDEHGRVLDADAVAALGATTRDSKTASNQLSPADLQAAWWSRLSADEKRLLDAIGSGAGPDGGGAVTPEDALAFGIAQTFARKSVASDRELLEASLRRGFGSVLPEDLKQRIPEREDARLIARKVEGQTWLTTPDALAAEEQLIAWARAGLDRCDPLTRQGYRYRNPDLNDGQNAAVRHVLTSTDRAIMIEGGAGTGKTTLTKAAEAQIRQAGKQVFFFAPSTTASRVKLREHFPDANTVEHLLRNEVLHQRLRGHVLWIDEAGQMGVRDMNRVFALAERLGCRVILSGDTKQHAPVSPGDAARLLKTKAGIRPAEVTEIMRQSGQYKEAVAAIRRGDLLQAFDLLDSMGWIREVPREELYTLPVEDTLWSRRAGQDVLVVTPTHRGGEQVTAVMRDALRKEGQLDAREQPVWVLRNLAWEAEKRDAVHYRPGLVVQFVQNAAGITNGERFQVTGRDEQGNVTARAVQDGRAIRLPLEYPERFQVYEPRRIVLAKGDLIQITQNGQTKDGHKLSNGMRYELAGFTENNDLRLQNGWIVGREYGHFTHGYYLTSHKSQSMDAPTMITAIGAEATPAVSAEQFYVTVSRGKKRALIYTDDKETLKRNIQRSAQRSSATELVAGEITHDGRPARIAQELRAAAQRYRAYLAAIEREPGEATLALVKGGENGGEAAGKGQAYGRSSMER